MTVEEAASNAVSALKGSPMCLALVLLMAILSVIAYYRESQAQDDRLHVTTALIERCMEPAKR